MVSDAFKCLLHISHLQTQLNQSANEHPQILSKVQQALAVNQATFESELVIKVTVFQSKQLHRL